MGGTIKINNPYVGAIIIIILLFLVWFVFGYFSGMASKSFGTLAWNILATLLFGYWYYNSFFKKNQEPIQN